MLIASNAPSLHYFTSRMKKISPYAWSGHPFCPEELESTLEMGTF